MALASSSPLLNALRSQALGYSLALATCALIYALVRQLIRRSYPLPPTCPPPKDRMRSFLHFAAMSKRPEFRELMSYQTGTKLTVVLNSLDAVHELFEKRSAIYSARPNLVLANIARGYQTGTLLSNRVGVWKKWRSILHATLMARAADSYRPEQEMESVVLLERLLHKPEDFDDHLLNYVANGVAEIAYGWRSSATKDPALVFHNQQQEKSFKRMAGQSIVDDYPLLRFTPNFIAKRFIPDLAEARQICMEDTARYVSLWNDSKRRIDAGSHAYSMVRSLHEQGLKQTGLPLSTLVMAVAIPYQAGIDTTLGMLSVFVLCAVNHGSVFLAKAQKELDNVVGADRLPTLDDDLPFTKAAVKECLRWSRAIPMALPHATADDDVFMPSDGTGARYLIPKGATVIANVYALGRDERIYQDPHTFRPERWLNGSTPLQMPAGAFGFGRRSCPGVHVAMNSLVLAVSRILWAFNIKATGTFDEDDQANYRSSALANWPSNIPATFSVRSARHAAIIKEEYQAVEPELDALAATY